MENVYEGGCVCGDVRYRARGEPAITAVCHCRFCQRRLGSAFATVAYFEQQNVEVLQGRVSEYEHRSDETGRWLRMQFCSRCGTTVTHCAEGRPGLKAIALGTLDDPNAIPVERHVWVRSKRPWVAVPSDVRAFPKGSIG